MTSPGAPTTVSAVVLACLLSGTPVWGKTAAGFLLTAAADEGLATQLGDALTANGWARVEGADGSALYKRPVSPEEQMAEPDETGELSLAERLGRQLEQQGWASSVAADGSMIYRMPAMQEAAPPAAAGEGTVAAQLRGQLEAQGWSASTAADGSVYYLPPAARLPRVSPTAGTLARA